MRGWRIVNSKSLPSSLAIATPFDSGFHDPPEGLAGADFRANNAKAWLLVGCCIPDIFFCRLLHTAKMAAHEKKTTYHGPVFTCSGAPTMHFAMTKPRV